MLVNPTYGAGGGESAEIYGADLLVADYGHTFITAQLTTEIETGAAVLISLNDSTVSKKAVAIATFDETPKVVTFSSEDGVISYTMTLTASTAGLTDYDGVFRPIYATVSRIDSSQICTAT